MHGCVHVCAAVHVCACVCVCADMWDLPQFTPFVPVSTSLPAVAGSLLAQVRSEGMDGWVQRESPQPHPRLPRPSTQTGH